MIVPLRDRQGEISEIVLLATNITEQVLTRRRIEELVRIAGTRAAELEATVSAMADAVTVCDADGTLRLVNRAALATYGVESVAELARMPVPRERIQLRYTDGTTVPAEERPLTRALAGETLQGDYTLFHHGLGRDIHCRTNAAPVRDTSGTIIGAVAVETDITTLIEVDRLKDEFFSMAAHELRTPLTAMKGYVQILSKQLAPLDGSMEPLVPRALSTLRDQGDRMERLINELLDVARIETGQLELHYREFDLIALIEQLVGEVTRSTQRHTVTFHAEPPSIPGRWDRDRLAQVFSNLLTNAVKYSPEGGTIQVSARWGNGTDQPVVIAIRDEGIGIEPEAIPRLFARYSRVVSNRTDRYAIPGLGVGLYISKQIIDAHRGQIHVDSRPGHGSIFTVTLPMG
jgi:PAS domain S-box-containing protein